jgi:hypothetical protein
MRGGERQTQCLYRVVRMYLRVAARTFRLNKLRVGERTIVAINSKKKRRLRLSPRLYLGVERAWRIGKISEKSRTQPALHIQVSRVIPISTTFGPPPIEPILVTRKRSAGED